MSRRYVNTLLDGETIEEVYLLADKQLRANRNAELYLLAQLRDRTGQISGLLWNVKEEALAHISAGQFVRIRGKVQLYQGNLQIILTHIAPQEVEELDLSDFIPGTSVETDRLLGRLKEILLTIERRPLRTLVECYLNDQSLMNDLARCPAGVKLHHAYHGGLLEHIVNLLETAIRIVDLYPPVDRDLLLVGIFLHDLGKVRELGFDAAFVYTDEGQLLGHLVIGIEMLHEKAALAEQVLGESLPEEHLLRIKHMIVSHHGSYEFGSPKLPMTPEAIFLHHLDNLDAKVNEFQSLIASDPNRWHEGVRLAADRRRSPAHSSALSTDLRPAPLDPLPARTQNGRRQRMHTHAPGTLKQTGLSQPRVELVGIRSARTGRSDGPVSPAAGAVAVSGDFRVQPG
jgi:3'-5' exoribonuclease